VVSDMKIKIMKGSIAFLILSLMISCREEELTGNYVFAKRNDLAWIGYSEIHIDHATDSLILWGISNQPNTEVIVIKIKFEGTGSYALTNRQGYYYSTIGGDVVTSEYKLPPNATGQVVISKYEQTRGFIEGSFEMSLKKERSNPDSGIDIYKFTKGIFKGEISK
jgi:hypothetical protein